MPTKVKAVYEGGVFRPLEPLDLREKTPVELTIEPLPQRNVVDETHGLVHIDPEAARVIAEDPFLRYGARQRPLNIPTAETVFIDANIFSTTLSACRDCP